MISDEKLGFLAVCGSIAAEFSVVAIAACSYPGSMVQRCLVFTPAIPAAAVQIGMFAALYRETKAEKRRHRELLGLTLDC